MAEEKKVHFIWEKTNYSGFVEKEYENSYLIVVANPSPDMEEKYTCLLYTSRNCGLRIFQRDQHIKIQEENNNG